MTTLFLYECLGLLSGFLSGLLGIGGGVLLLPALLFVLPLIGGEVITPFIATEVSMIQVAVASLTGILIHRPSSHVPAGRIALWAGAALLGGGAGGMLSFRLSGRTILEFFLAEILLALILLAKRPLPVNRSIGEDQRRNSWLEYPVMCGIGLTSGILGVGGGFLF